MRAEYLLAILPSRSVEKVVRDLKDELSYKIGPYPACNSIPHITILWVWIDDSLEHILFNSLRKILAQEHPITITTNGIGYLPSNKTIYIGIKENNLFFRMNKNVSSSSLIAGLPSKFKSSSFVPHLTIGRSLNSNFEIARDYFGEFS